MAIRIERMTASNWERIRSIRLRALVDAPDSFARGLDEESNHPLSFWQERLASEKSAYFVATDGPNDIGMVGGGPWDDDPRGAGLYSMWVAPDERGRGMADRLIEAVID
ncbi:MAG: ribosomal protein S18 acetylase RimI-like enzyme [Planctomycetota bacterium]|jgi:ribosomal protein S18 acetylase RimI-like enzyme